MTGTSDPLPAAPEPALSIPSGPRPVVRLLVAVVGIVVLVLVFRWLPDLMHTSWPEILDLLAGVHPWALVGLAAIWVATLVAHAAVQVSALPGLGMWDAMLLNMASSAVSSAVPFGGPVSLAINWSMLRSWGFDSVHFSSYTIVTTVVSAVIRLIVPVVAALVLLAGGGLAAQTGQLAVVAGIALVVVAGLMAVLAAPPLRRRLANAPHHRRLGRLAREVDDAIGRTFSVLRRRWRGLLGGSTLQIVLQYLLLLGCFAAVGAGVGPVVALVAFGAGRLASVLPVTPGGLGVTEAAVGALLVALGADAGTTLAALLIFAFFMVVVEVPLGAIVVLVWRLRGGRRAPVPVS